MGGRLGTDLLANVSAVVLAGFVAYAFAEYAVGHDPIGCAYEAGSDEETSCLARRQFWLGAFGLIGLLLTVIYTGKAAKAASESARVAEQSLKITQRAFVSVEPLGLRDFDGPEGNRFVAHFSIRNSGHLPANELSWWVDVTVDSNNLRERFPVPKKGLRGSHVIAPNRSMTRGAAAKSNSLLMGNLMGRETFCYVWGRVQYKDGFGEDRFTNFCHRYNAQGVTLLKPVDIPADRGRQHDYGNEAT